MDSAKQHFYLNSLRGYIEPPEGDWELGSIGPYSLVSFLGAGGMAIVFLAMDRHSGRMLALKCIRPDRLVHGPDYIQRFESEIALMKTVDSDFCVRIIASGVFQAQGGTRSLPYFCLDYVQGRTLEEKLARWEGRLPQREVLRIGIELARGLADMHAKGCYHRDLSTNNILMDTEMFEKVRISDFGLAFSWKRPAGDISLGDVVGTPAFIAPERWQDYRAITARGDLFSLGCVLYQALAGRRAFSDQDHSTLREQPRPILEINVRFDADLAGLIMQLLEKDPERRPGDAQEVQSRLEAMEEQILAAPSLRGHWPQPSSHDIRQKLQRIGGRSLGLPVLWSKGWPGVLLGLVNQRRVADELCNACYSTAQELTFLASRLTSAPKNLEEQRLLLKSIVARLERYRETGHRAKGSAGGLPEFSTLIEDSLRIAEELIAFANDELEAVLLGREPDLTEVRKRTLRSVTGLAACSQKMLANHQRVNDLLMSHLDGWEPTQSNTAREQPVVRSDPPASALETVPWSSRRNLIASIRPLGIVAGPIGWERLLWLGVLIAAAAGIALAGALYAAWQLGGKT